MSRPRTQFDRIVHAVRYGSGTIRALAIAASALVTAGFVLVAFRFAFHGPDWVLKISQLCVLLGAVAASVMQSFQRTEEVARTRRKIEAAERKVADNPKEPQAAWELAQVKLESYLKANLAQVKSVYILTVVVMIIGFSLIIAGSIEAFRYPNQFQASVLSSLSGVVVTFIGGTFLVLHRATMNQAKDYVTILERINAVGMSMQILESLGTADHDLKQETTAAIAQQLLSMYSQHVPKFDIRTGRGKIRGTGPSQT